MNCRSIKELQNNYNVDIGPLMFRVSGLFCKSICCIFIITKSSQMRIQSTASIVSHIDPTFLLHLSFGMKIRHTQDISSHIHSKWDGKSRKGLIYLKYQTSTASWLLKILRKEYETLFFQILHRPFSRNAIKYEEMLLIVSFTLYLKIPVPKEVYIDNMYKHTPRVEHAHTMTKNTQWNLPKA